MKKLVISFILWALVILEATVLDRMRILSVKPDLSLAAVVTLSFFYSPPQTLAFSLLAGFLKDTLSIGPLGLNTIIFVLIGYTISRLSKKFLIESLSLRVLIISLAVLLENILAQFFLSFYGKPIPLGTFAISSFIAAFYTAIISPLIIKMIRCI